MSDSFLNLLPRHEIQILYHGGSERKIFLDADNDDSFSYMCFQPTQTIANAIIIIALSGSCENVTKYMIYI